MPSINYLAVLVSAIAVFAIGALWYSQLLLGKQWARAHGYPPEKVEQMRKGAGRAYLVTFLCYVVMAAVMAVLIGECGIATTLGGVKLGGAAWLGFAATIGLTANMYSEKPLATYLIDAAYQLIYLLVMGVILVNWR